MKQQSFICNTCGIEYEPSHQPPPVCKICADERQYINAKGQSWTVLSDINKGHKNIIEKISPNLYAIYTTPAFAIGQRAHLLQTPHGNILWDCIANLDASTIDLLNRLGGIDMIAISHPHYYTTMAGWSKAFHDAPVYLHEGDEQWIARRDCNLVLWSGHTKQLNDGVTLINCGGHFAGGQVMHYNNMLLAGDIIMVCPDLKSVSFMYSYPNMIPLAKNDILHIRESLKPYKIEAMYGAFGMYIRADADKALQFSIDRYLRIYE